VSLCLVSLCLVSLCLVSLCLVSFLHWHPQTVVLLVFTSACGAYKQSICVLWLCHYLIPSARGGNQTLNPWPQDDEVSVLPLCYPLTPMANSVDRPKNCLFIYFLPKNVAPCLFLSKKILLFSFLSSQFCPISVSFSIRHY